jgi:hypothetical protein
MEESTYQQFIELLEHRVKSHTPQESILRSFAIEYEWSELNTLRDEICKCIFCGFPQATVTLTNMLLEMAVSTMLFYAGGSHLCKDESKINKKDFPHTDSLGYHIEELYAYDLIAENQKQQLHNLRQSVRNPFSHADIGAEIKKKELPMICYDAGKQTITQDNKTLKDLPMFNGLAFYFQAQDSHITYFLYVDYIIRTVSSKLTTSK